MQTNNDVVSPDLGPSAGSNSAPNKPDPVQKERSALKAIFTTRLNERRQEAFIQDLEIVTTGSREAVSAALTGDIVLAINKLSEQQVRDMLEMYKEFERKPKSQPQPTRQTTAESAAKPTSPAPAQAKDKSGAAPALDLKGIGAAADRLVNEIGRIVGQKGTMRAQRKAKRAELAALVAKLPKADQAKYKNHLPDAGTEAAPRATADAPRATPVKPLSVLEIRARTETTWAGIVRSAEEGNEAALKDAIIRYRRNCGLYAEVLAREFGETAKEDPSWVDLRAKLFATIGTDSGLDELVPLISEMKKARIAKNAPIIQALPRDHRKTHRAEALEAEAAEAEAVAERGQKEEPEHYHYVYRKEGSQLSNAIVAASWLNGQKPLLAQLNRTIEQENAEQERLLGDLNDIFGDIFRLETTLIEKARPVFGNQTMDLAGSVIPSIQAASPEKITELKADAALKFSAITGAIKTYGKGSVEHQAAVEESRKTKRILALAQIPTLVELKALAEQFLAIPPDRMARYAQIVDRLSQLNGSITQNEQLREEVQPYIEDAELALRSALGKFTLKDPKDQQVCKLRELSIENRDKKSVLVIKGRPVDGGKVRIIVELLPEQCDQLPKGLSLEKALQLAYGESSRIKEWGKEATKFARESGRIAPIDRSVPRATTPRTPVRMAPPTQSERSRNRLARKSFEGASGGHRGPLARTLTLDEADRAAVAEYGTREAHDKDVNPERVEKEGGSGKINKKKSSAEQRMEDEEKMMGLWTGKEGEGGGVGIVNLIENRADYTTQDYNKFLREYLVRYCNLFERYNESRGRLLKQEEFKANPELCLARKALIEGIKTQVVSQRKGGLEVVMPLVVAYSKYLPGGEINVDATSAEIIKPVDILDQNGIRARLGHSPKPERLSAQDRESRLPLLRQEMANFWQQTIAPLIAKKESVEGAAGKSRYARLSKEERGSLISELKHYAALYRVYRGVLGRDAFRRELAKNEAQATALQSLVQAIESGAHLRQMMVLAIAYEQLLNPAGNSEKKAE